MISPIDLNSTTIGLGQYNNISNNSNNDSYFGNSPVFPPYIRTTATIICSLIMGVGVLGNIMVPLVIFKSKDMRNSTNIFLMNLSLADIMVLLVCTPTVLVEVNSRPETWVLGEEMCRAVPFIEMMVTHASVLTILAISFERYYAICEPLKAGYICTKTRAFFICLCAWFLAGLLTSPMLFISQYELAQYSDGSLVPACLTPADTFWKELFFYMSISLFFWVPLVILLLLYTIIVVRLMADPGVKGSETFTHRGRSQLVAMLGTVVLSFFLCLMPFRVFLPWYISASAETIKNLGIEKYFNILYFCKTMSYVHSAINPVLYNIMSTKFRDGFMRVCGFRTRRMMTHRKSWAYMNSLNSASLSNASMRRDRDSFGSVQYRGFAELSRSCKFTGKIAHFEDLRSANSIGSKGEIIATSRAKTEGDFSSKFLYIKSPSSRPHCLTKLDFQTNAITKSIRLNRESVKLDDASDRSSSNGSSLRLSAELKSSESPEEDRTAKVELLKTEKSKSDEDFVKTSKNSTDRVDADKLEPSLFKSVSEGKSNARSSSIRRNFLKTKMRERLYSDGQEDGVFRRVKCRGTCSKAEMPFCANLQCGNGEGDVWL